MKIKAREKGAEEGTEIYCLSLESREEEERRLGFFFESYRTVNRERNSKFSIRIFFKFIVRSLIFILEY
jgi:hypothetical protein